MHYTYLNNNKKKQQIGTDGEWSNGTPAERWLGVQMTDNLAQCTFIRFVVVAVVIFVVITTIWSRRFDGATACS